MNNKSIYLSKLSSPENRPKSLTVSNTDFETNNNLNNNTNLMLANYLTENNKLAINEVDGFQNITKSSTINQIQKIYCNRCGALREDEYCTVCISILNMDDNKSISEEEIKNIIDLKMRVGNMPTEIINNIREFEDSKKIYDDAYTWMYSETTPERKVNYGVDKVSKMIEALNADDVHFRDSIYKLSNTAGVHDKNNDLFIKDNCIVLVNEVVQSIYCVNITDHVLLDWCTDRINNVHMNANKFINIINNYNQSSSKHIVDYIEAKVTGVKIRLLNPIDSASKRPILIESKKIKSMMYSSTYAKPKFISISAYERIIKYTCNMLQYRLEKIIHCCTGLNIKLPKYGLMGGSNNTEIDNAQFDTATEHKANIALEEAKHGLTNNIAANIKTVGANLLKLPFRTAEKVIPSFPYLQTLTDTFLCETMSKRELFASGSNLC